MRLPWGVVGVGGLPWSRTYCSSFKRPPAVGHVGHFPFVIMRSKAGRMILYKRLIISLGYIPRETPRGGASVRCVSFLRLWTHHARSPSGSSLPAFLASWISESDAAQSTCFRSTVPASPHGFGGRASPCLSCLPEVCGVLLGLHSVMLRHLPGGKVLPRCGRREGEMLGALRGRSRGMSLPLPPTSLVSRGSNLAPSLPTSHM